MKKNNLVKRLGIASLCLATSISAFSGIASFEKNVALAESTTTVSEEATTNPWNNWVTASEGATVEQESRIVYLKKNASQGAKNCLRVSSDVPYEATFNRVFENNTTFRFSFPELKPEEVTETTHWGDFKFRVSDVMDDTNFFDIVYRRMNYGTLIYVEWNGNTVQAFTGSATAANSTTSYFYNEIDTRSSARVAPTFMQYGGSYVKREGKLTLSWSGDVLRVLANTTDKGDTSDAITTYVAKFDGSYDETKSKNGFSDKSKWGLPKMNFPHGYKISFSSSYSNAYTTDQATDVSFWKIASDGTTYTFDNEPTTKDNYMKAYDTITASENAGKALLGWKDETGLYPTTTAVQSADISAYDPVFLGFDTINGASVRIDTSEGGKSGIRFMTLFDQAEYKTAKKYIQSFGTLLSYTDDLTKGNFIIANYQTEIDAQSTSIRQVANTTKTFKYDLATGLIGASGQPAYSIAVVDIEDYTQKYSVRGYIEVKYADETTQIIYTDYNEADNSRSIAEVAYKIKTNAAAEYESYEQAYKDVIDGYADAYVAP